MSRLNATNSIVPNKRYLDVTNSKSFTNVILESKRITGDVMDHTQYAMSRLNATTSIERWGAGVETQKNVRGEIGGWGRVPFNETYAPSLSTIYDGA